MKSRVYTFSLAFAASLGCLSAGMLFTNLNASLSKVLSAIDTPGNTDCFYISFLSAIIPFGAIFGALTTSHTLDTIGRRYNMIIADILPIVGCALSIVPDFFAMFFGRFMCGVACGINFAVVPLYISEISSLSSERKGTPYSRLMFSFGMLLTFALASLVDLSTSDFADHWKVLFLLPMLFSIIRLIVFVMFVKSDTAAFYLATNREEEALKVLKNLWSEDEVDIAYRQSNPRDNVAALSGIMDYKYTKQAKIIMLLIFIAQFMGANILLFHSTMIFAGRRDQKLADYTRLEGQNLCLGIAMFAVTVLGSKMIERLRRRLSLVYGTLVMTGLCFLIAGSEAISFWFGEATLIIVYGALQALLFGVIMPAYCEDMLPLLSLSSIVLMEMILGMIAVAVAPFVGVKALFIAFGIVGALGFVPVFKKVKETKGKTKDEVIKMFHSTKENGLLDEEVAQLDTSMY